MKQKILVTYRIPEESLTILEQEGFMLIWPEGERMSPEEMLNKIEDCVAVVAVFGVPFPDKALERGKQLKIISNYGAGVDNLNLSLATQTGVVVTNTPDEVTEPTAEIAVGLMLALARDIPGLDRKIRNPGSVQWGVMQNLGTTLQGKMLGILGFGRIGQATARRAQALGMKIIYHSRHRIDEKIENSLGATYVTFDALVETSDILSIHTPLTPETFHKINAEVLEKMKPGAMLVNTARGAVVDEKALIEALTTRIISGAALDVFEFEPAIPDAFLSLDNVVLVPHIGTATWETRKAIGTRAAINILEYLRGNSPQYCVNPEVLK